jgi:hypothetical protein
MSSLAVWQKKTIRPTLAGGNWSGPNCYSDRNSVPSRRIAANIAKLPVHDIGEMLQ